MVVFKGNVLTSSLNGTKVWTPGDVQCKLQIEGAKKMLCAFGDTVATVDDFLNFYEAK
jgi:hypothetical protein